MNTLHRRIEILEKAVIKAGACQECFWQRINPYFILTVIFLDFFGFFSEFRLSIDFIQQILN